ncbi:hypothetical protein HI914_00837 [Erysiphe necator]|nr:hypothetical protein HI914_00837 [Erysiphe necator]
MYACIGTRPDLAYAATLLSQFSSCLNKTHLTDAKRVLCYLKGFMRIIVPNLNSDSSSSLSPSEESFQTALGLLFSPSLISIVNMLGSSKGFDIEMGEANANALRGLSAEDIQELVNLLAEKR